MAFAGDAIAEAEAATTKKNGRRISDYLRNSDGDGATPPSPPETPPRLRLPRFTCARLRFGKIGRKGSGGGRGRKQQVPAADKSQDTSAESSGSNKQPESSTTSSSASAEAGGMGLSMLLLLARTCVELNRMAEVRAQMEALLKEMRDEASRMKGANHAVVVTPRTCNLVHSSSASSSCTSDTNTNCLEIAGGDAGEREKNEPSQDDRRARTDALEAEVDAESSSDDEFIELEGWRFGCGGGGFGRGIGDEEDSEEEESTGGAREDGGVSAIELKRRLHELLHRRDRERIEELEAGLRRAERRLTEKEMEARMWQDTATHALQAPQPQPRRDVQ